MKKNETKSENKAIDTCRKKAEDRREGINRKEKLGRYATNERCFSVRKNGRRCSPLNLLTN